jgi:membrane-bound lytic murein transglycosylase A
MRAGLWLTVACLAALPLGCGLGWRSPQPPPSAERIAAAAPEAVLSVAPASSPAAGPFAALSGARRVAMSGRLSPLGQGLASWTELGEPLSRSLEFVSAKPQQETALQVGGLRLTWGQVGQSLKRLIELLPVLDRRPELLARHFQWYALNPAPLMTAYYTPEIEASLTRRPGYRHPIYGVPEELAGGSPRRPWLDRRAIDVRGALKGRGLEIAWAKDPLDVFWLHVQGCGQLRLPGGSVKRVLYGASNGHGFTGLGQILRERGLLAADRLGREHIRRYFERHPRGMRELLAENRRYIFFRLADDEPEGAMGKPLTPLVSLATDPSLLPLGSVLALEAELPAAPASGFAEVPRPVRGIGLVQDVGAAIKGLRLDYYIGAGQEAALVADRVRAPATVYLLLSKEAVTR